MYHHAPRAALLACAFGLSFSAQAQQPSVPVAGESGLVKLRYATFDPLDSEPAVPASLRDNGNLWIVQFRGTPTELGRSGIRESGARLHGYLPDNAYVVRMPEQLVDTVSGLEGIRWVGRYSAAYRIDPALIAALDAGRLEGTRKYNMVVTDKHTDKPALAAGIQALGGAVVDDHFGSLLFTVALTGEQLPKAAQLDEVLWIDEWTPKEEDMDNARIQGGGNYLESQTGYTGSGVNAHIYEGIEATHPDFTGGATNVNSSGASASHGHATAGIVFGNGTSNASVRGMAPDCGKFYTNYSTTTSRWTVVNNLVNTHNVSHTTASWGDARTFFYTSVSADADDIIFDHDIAWTQSQSNAGNQDSRPQAWAKNIFSIGGVAHYNNSNPGDDSWAGGGGSTGPAADGRIKPTLASYYDSIGTSDLSGSSGYSASNWYGGFGGTSGATPIVAGHNVLAIQMFTDDSGTPGVGPFGNPLRSPGASSHVNRPHFTTLKALQVASASQYSFNAASTNNRREHVGWGFPNVQTMWDDRGKTYIVDETDVMTQGEARRFDVDVSAGEPSLRVVLNYSELAANPAAAKTLINDLTLRVTSPSNTVYWGNNGLEQGNWSVVGGSADDTNPIECVLVANPAAGVWHVDIIASAIVADSHVETPATDADYGLVIVGGQTTPGNPPVFASFSKYGQGCPGSVPQSAYCASLNENGGALTNNTNTYEYTFTVSGLGSAQVTSFDIYTYSNSGTLVRPAHIYAQSGGGPASTPLASTTITVGSAPGFYTATFASPVSVSGTFYVGYENSPGGIISNLSSGAQGIGHYRTAVTGSWSQSSLVQRPSWRVNCVGGQQFATPALGNSGLPILGSTYNVTLADAVPGSGAFILSGLSDTVYGGQPLPAALTGAPGCLVYAAPDTTLLLFTSGAGTASTPVGVPNTPGLVGLNVYHQWAILDAVNMLGLVVSDAGRASLGN